MSGNTNTKESVKAEKKPWEQAEPDLNFFKYEDYKAYKSRISDPDVLSKKHVFRNLSILN